MECIKCKRRKKTIVRQANVIAGKNSELRFVRLRLKKIKSLVDYILEHPFSLDMSNKRRK